MGRAEGLPTITLEPRELPLLRFIDRPRVHYPGIELVADAELSADSDLYLADHLLDGDLLFPAVLGMEAMTQAAAALTGRAGAPVVLEDVEFLRPIVVPPDGTTTIRIAALRPRRRRRRRDPQQRDRLPGRSLPGDAPATGAPVPSTLTGRCRLSGQSRWSRSTRRPTCTAASCSRASGSSGSSATGGSPPRRASRRSRPDPATTGSRSYLPGTWCSATRVPGTR